jgi:chorismate-pyruvate lyase
VEQFRQVNWIGESEVELENKFKLMGLTRSYSIKSGGEVICEVEEFFTPKFFLMFNNK